MSCAVFAVLWFSCVCAQTSSSFISQYGLLHVGELACLPLPVQQLLHTIQHAVYKLLRLAASLGEVVIITNSQQGWVEHSCKAFFPSLLEHLEGMPIVSARTSYEHLYPDNPLCWKVSRCLHHAIF